MNHVMTIQQIKEQISKHLIYLIANRKGYKITEPYLDNGVDLMLIRVKKIDRNGRIRYLDTGDLLAIQLKCRTESQLKEDNNTIKIDIETKNYNDLIFRFEERKRTLNKRIPLILLSFILPDDINDWMFSKKLNETVIKGRYYWYYPNEGDVSSFNKYSQRIAIPKSNLINLNNFDEVINKILN